MPTETSDISYVFSTFYILYGTSIVVGTVSLMAKFVLNYTEEKSRMRWRHTHIDELKSIPSPSPKTPEGNGQNQTSSMFLCEPIFSWSSSFLILVAFIAWVSFGVWFGVVYEGFDFYKGVYFVISGLSGCGMLFRIHLGPYLCISTHTDSYAHI